MSDYSLLLERLKSNSQEAPWPAANERILLEPYRYLAEQPGKDIRGALIDAFNIWLQVPSEALEVIKTIVQQLHTASLLVDDVEDSSDLRRGNPVAHKIFGVAQTVNGANYVYFLALRQLADLEVRTGHNLLQDVNEELLNLHRGQGMELFWRDNLVCPTEDEYLQMVNNKTSGLFRVAIRLMLALAQSGKDENLIPLIDLLGITFQICDDYQNLQSDKYSENKGFCEDLTEGKFSFPIIHAIRADPSNLRLINVLRQRPVDVSVKSWAVTYMRDHTKSFEHTLEIIHTLQHQAEAEINRMGGNPALLKILFRICSVQTTM